MGKHEKRNIRRFVLENCIEGKSYECVVFSNGCVAINLHPVYPTHYCNMEAFSNALITEGVHTITWIDKEDAAYSSIFKAMLPSGKARLCKSLMQQFDSVHRLLFLHPNL